MTTLEAKFEALETALATQHTEIMNALDTIAMALGAPPPGPTTTLADIATMLSSLNDSLSGILSANATYYASNLEVLGLINTNVDTMLNNNSLNTQKLISAIYATYCACSTTAPLLPTPLDTTPTSLADQDKCKRIQFYISLFGRWLDKIANYGNSASFITGDVIGTLLGLAAADAGLVATGAEVGAAAGPPGVVIGAVVGLIIGAIYTLGGSVLIDYASQFNAPTLKAALLAAMFAANTADEGTAAFQSVIGANFSTIPAGIINALWWASWSNDVYSGTPTVDDSAFDGTICVPDDGCAEIDSVATTATDSSFPQLANRQCIFFPDITARGSSFAGTSFDPAVVVGQDMVGWVLTCIAGAGCSVVYSDGSNHRIFLAVGDSFTIPSGNVSFFVDDVTSSLGLSGAYTVRWCQPGL